MAEENNGETKQEESEDGIRAHEGEKQGLSTAACTANSCADGERSRSRAPPLNQLTIPLFCGQAPMGTMRNLQRHPDDIPPSVVTSLGTTSADVPTTAAVGADIVSYLTVWVFNGPIDETAQKLIPQ
ncbi:hypothetical protein F2P81_019464 [Scophthalmus maximus]|uniref:Uncharacterized protein n=1 Tax=Scophthalmus maximus TaxID=52904 RepID=A0A6A4S5S8_SCOMX|nr:hypothetical protein F2P81_019464 [Scophthalmus maximus]